MDDNRDTSATKEMTVRSETSFENINQYYHYYYEDSTDQWAAYEKANFGFSIGFLCLGLVDGSTMLRKSTYFINDYEISNESALKRINITRAGDSKFDGNSVNSKLTAYNPDGSVFVEYSYTTANTTHVLPQAGYKLVITAYDFPNESKTIWDDTGTVSGDYRLYGYVFDAADSFLLNNTVVTFASEEYTTSENGYYEFNRDYSGSYLLGASKSGYQALNGGDGVYVNLTGTTRLDISLVQNVTVNSGTCTVAGLVLDSITNVPVSDAIVRIENSSYDVYIYTNDMGYFVFYDLINSTYSLSASADGYYSVQKDISLPDLDTAYYYQLNLVSVSTAPPTPTPTPGPGEEESPTVSGWKTIFEMMGLLDYMGYILAFLCMLAMGAGFGYIVHGSAVGVLIGAFFGYVIDVAIGWLPVWTVAVVVSVVAFFIAKNVAK